jgi:regulation of enolase protein 1 (concanavalin A-like superfamily)
MEGTAVAQDIDTNKGFIIEERNLSTGTYYLQVTGNSDEKYARFNLHTQFWRTASSIGGGSGSLVSAAGGEITLNAEGSDIWGTSDEGFFMYTPISGDCALSARVRSLSNTNEWAKGGVMIRNTTNGNSTNAFSLVSYSRGCQSQVRYETSGETGSSANTALSPGNNSYVKIIRNGNVVSTYYSYNGLQWKKQRSYNLNLQDEILIGLAATSHNEGTTATVVFDTIVLEKSE